MDGGKNEWVDFGEGRKIMGNMSYCRFENTHRDLSDCYYHFDEELSESEKKYRQRIIKLCRDIMDDYGDEI